MIETLDNWWWEEKEHAIANRLSLEISEENEVIRVTSTSKEKRSNLKLFVWNPSVYYGVSFSVALAESVQEARDMLSVSGENETDFSDPPDVYELDSAVAFTLYYST